MSAPTKRQQTGNKAEKEKIPLAAFAEETITPSVWTISSLFVDSQVGLLSLKSAVGYYSIRIRLSQELLLTVSVS